MMSQNYVIIKQWPIKSSLLFSCNDIGSGPKNFMYDARPSLGACIDGMVCKESKQAILANTDSSL